MAEVLEYPRGQFVWIDEMGSDHHNAMCKYGYAIRGETPQCYHSQVRGQRISAISALTSTGIVATEHTVFQACKW